VSIVTKLFLYVIFLFYLHATLALPLYFHFSSPVTESMLMYSASVSRRARARGFTLIEIMVVVVIMGILAALVVPKLMGRTDDARIMAARQDISTLMQSLKLYRLDNQRYPTTEQGLQALVSKPTGGPAANGWKQGGYIDKLPKDPWGNPYQYLSPGLRGEVDVFSLGADGQPGGTGNDADIGSWDL
jgi:general secretion pathway protein G